MASVTDWRSELSTVDRYNNIEKLRKGFEANELSHGTIARKAAFAAETNAYDSSDSRVSDGGAYFLGHVEIYNTRVVVSVTIDASAPSEAIKSPQSSGTSIGSYRDCHHIASGLVSQVYRTEALALKVITETRNVEPHNPAIEVKLLKTLSHPSIITLNSTFHDQEGHLVLVFPYQPLTLAQLLESGPIPSTLVKSIFQNLFSALSYLHSQNIIHRDIKPSNLLLSSPTGPALLSDFGTAWHPTLSQSTEPSYHKILEVGTTAYRAPETLFGHRSYSTAIDLWATGTMLVECLRSPPKSLFESRGGDEDGNQLGLILSIFKTLGTPTRDIWPEAQGFSTPPFEWYQSFEGRSWAELLPGVGDEASDLVRRLVCFESGQRLRAKEALEHPYLKRNG